jgi:hypothetical protein
MHRWNIDVEPRECIPAMINEFELKGFGVTLGPTYSPGIKLFMFSVIHPKEHAMMMLRLALAPHQIITIIDEFEYDDA